MRSDAVVFVVDDSAGVREGLRMLIESAGWTAETYSSAEEFLRAYDPSKAGCLVLDLRMPEMNGLELQKKLTTSMIQLPIIFITGYGDIPTAVSTIQAGAFDYIEKPFNGEALLSSIRRALESFNQQSALRESKLKIRERLRLLTRRQREVLDLVLAGMANKEIAAQLQLSSKTVEKHRDKIMSKMQARNSVDLARLVLKAEDFQE